jgi:tight adherence protein B
MPLYTLLPALILLMGAAIITIAFVMTPNTAAQRERRINLISNPASGKAASALAEAERKSRGARLDARMRQVFAVGAGNNWGMHSGAVLLLSASAICGIVAWLLALRMGGLPWWLAAPSGVLGAFLGPRFLLLREQSRAEARFMDLFPDAIDTIVRMLRAGLPMTSAVRIVGNEAAAPVNAVFAMISDQVKIGIPIEEALDAGSRQIGLADFRFFAVAVLLQYSAGGNIAATLEMLSGIMRKRRAMRQKAKAATAEIRLTGYVLGSLPFLTIGALLAIQPGYLKPLFIDPRGHVILGMAAGGLFLSFITMRQMMRSVTKG